MSSRTALGEHWPRLGFVDLPAWMVKALSQALHRDPPWERSPRPTADVYMQSLRRWECRHVPIDPRIGEWAYRVLLDPRPRPVQQTISDIYVDENQSFAAQSFGPIDDGWDLCRFAQVVYYDLWFHLSSEQLKDVEGLFRQIDLLAHSIAFSVDGRPRLGTLTESYALRLALYERNRAIAYDIVTHQLRYLTHVAERAELTRSDRDYRIYLFRLANERFHELLRAELK